MLGHVICSKRVQNDSNSYQTLRRGVAQILYAKNVDNMQQVLALL